MADLIANWWNSFSKRAPRIDALFRGNDDWDLPEWMLENLQVIHPQLMWEFGPARRGPGHRLVITAESRRDLRPLVREILRRAPLIEGWEFYEYRPPEEFEDAAASVEGRVSGDIRALTVVAKPGDFNCVDLQFRGFPPGTDDHQALQIAYVATETLLGEAVLDRWIGAIDVAPDSSDGEESFAIVELPAKVAQLIDEIQNTLPARPWHEVEIEEETNWSVMEIDSEPADDCVKQEDQLVAITLFPALLQNVHSSYAFDSARFSRCGERFCYLKIDGSDGLEGSLFSDRAEIEDAINAVLRPAKLGTTIGGGTGHRYSYVELALTDIDGAWREMRLVLQEGHLPTRTWLLFHDDESSREWRGLYDDSPAPLMPEVEEDED